MKRIPEITDERIKELLKSIKPVVFKKDKPFYIKPVDSRTAAFTWDPKTTKAAKGLIPLATITTYHTYGYYGFFKPSVAEVLAQIPEALVGNIVAFSTQGPGSASDLNDHKQELNEGYHVAKTTLYGKG
jgi:hypothetical protein